MSLIASLLLALPPVLQAEVTVGVLAGKTHENPGGQDLALLDVLRKLRELPVQSPGDRNLSPEEQKAKDQAESKELFAAIDATITEEISSKNLARLALLCEAMDDGEAGRADHDRVWTNATWRCIRVLAARGDEAFQALTTIYYGMRIQGHAAERWRELTGGIIECDPKTGTCRPLSPKSAPTGTK